MKFSFIVEYPTHEIQSLVEYPTHKIQFFTELSIICHGISRFMEGKRFFRINFVNKIGLVNANLLKNIVLYTELFGIIF